MQQTLPFHSVHVAILLTHAIASSLRSDEDGGEFLPGIGSGLAMEVMANYLFNQQEDLWSRLDRYGMLWEHYGSTVDPKVQLRATADELFVEATGVDRRDLFAVGVSLSARVRDWKPDRPFRWNPADGLGMDSATIRRCLDLLCADLETLRGELNRDAGRWDVLPFERHPVLIWPDGSAVVLDERFLWDRVTSGLYWSVLEHEQQAHGEVAAGRWSQAYGDMWERWAEDRLAGMTPRVIGGGRTYYTEDDVERAYGTKRADAAIDFGRGLALIEVQKGQISLALRSNADFAAFVSDTKKIVLDKLEQLDETAKAVLKNPSRLLGYNPPANYTVYPTLVLGGTYPFNPLSAEYVQAKRTELGLLTGRGVADLAIIDAAELEMCEALWHRRGIPLIEVIESWKRSGGFRFSLRNHILEAYLDDPIALRPPRMEPADNGLFEDVKNRLRLSNEPEDSSQ